MLVNRLTYTPPVERPNQRPRPAPRWPPAPPARPLVGELFLDECHKLLCKADDPIYEERKKLCEQFKVGQAGLVGGITTVLVPHLGMSATLIGPGVAAVLLMVGRVGLAAWCVRQTARRKAAEERRTAQQKEYDEYIKGQSTDQES